MRSGRSTPSPQHSVLVPIEWIVDIGSPVSAFFVLFSVSSEQSYIYNPLPEQSPASCASAVLGSIIDAPLSLVSPPDAGVVRLDISVLIQSSLVPPSLVHSLPGLTELFKMFHRHVVSLHVNPGHISIIKVSSKEQTISSVKS